MAVVVPAPGELKETARLLLELADSPADVLTVSNGTQFEVPDAVADAYHEHRSGKSPARPAKRRGRAPRAAEKE